jgi:predicted acyltransferase (DUF342 family)
MMRRYYFLALLAGSLLGVTSVGIAEGLDGDNGLIESGTGGEGSFAGGTITSAINFSGVNPDITTPGSENFSIQPGGIIMMLKQLVISGVTTDITTSGNETLTLQGAGSGTVSINDAADVTGTLGVTGELTVTGESNINGILDANSDADFAKTVTIAGILDANSDVDIAKTLTVGGQITANAAATFNFPVNAYEGIIGPSDEDLFLEAGTGHRVVIRSGLVGYNDALKIGGDYTKVYIDGATDEATVKDDLEVGDKLHVVGNINAHNGIAMYNPGTSTISGVINNVADDALKIVANSADGSANHYVMVAPYAYRNSDYNRDTPATDPHFEVCSRTDPASSATQCVDISHDTTGGIINSKVGNLTLQPTVGSAIRTTSWVTGDGSSFLTIGKANPGTALTTTMDADDVLITEDLEIIGGTVIQGNLNLPSSGATITSPWHSSSVSGGYGLGSYSNSSHSLIGPDTTFDQVGFGLGTSHGRQIVFGLRTTMKDYDISEQSYPQVCVQSGIDADSDNTQHFCLYHTGTVATMALGDTAETIELKARSHTYYGFINYSESITGTTSDVAMTNQNEWYEVDGLTDTADGMKNGMTIANGDFTITNTAVYKLSYCISASISAGTQDVETAVSIDDVIKLECVTQRNFGGTTTGNTCGACIIPLTATDVVSIEVRNRTSAGKTLSIEEASFIINQL